VAWCEGVARALAPLVDAATDPDGVLPGSCRLPDVLGLDPIGSAAIASRWARSDGQPAAALGMGGDGPC
jgi:S-DNA-T family DNA segregation ATPase FtsK/SpoIIIE